MSTVNIRYYKIIKSEKKNVIICHPSLSVVYSSAINHPLLFSPLPVSVFTKPEKMSQLIETK